MTAGSERGGATRRRGQSRLSIVDQRAGANLSSPAEARRSPRHRGHGPGHGLRQWRADVRRRRRVLARSLHRAGEADDRPRARCPGRGCRLGAANARHRRDHRPHAARHRRRTRRYFQAAGAGFGDVQDIEFTIEDGKLWILQTRSAKRTPRAALRIAIDLVRENLITPHEALQRIDGIELDALTEDRVGRHGRSARDRGRCVGRHRGRTRRLRIRERPAPGGFRRAGDPDAPRYQHRRCRGLCRRGGDRDCGRRPHRRMPRWWPASWENPASSDATA